MIEKKDYRDAVSRISAAICVVTTNGIGGLAGFTASAVCSLTDSPGMLLVCLQIKSSAYQAVKTNQVVCINTLGADSAQLVKRFSEKGSMVERFKEVVWFESSTGSPVLANAMVSFDCDVIETKCVETHEILLCRVRNIIYGNTDQHALVYYNRQVHRLS
jgi:flavin reductase